MSEALVIAVALLCQSPNANQRGWQEKLECQKKLALCLKTHVEKTGLLNERTLVRCIAEDK